MACLDTSFCNRKIKFRTRGKTSSLVSMKRPKNIWRSHQQSQAHTTSHPPNAPELEQQCPYAKALQGGQSSPDSQVSEKQLPSSHDGMGNTQDFFSNLSLGNPRIKSSELNLVKRSKLK